MIVLTSTHSLECTACGRVYAEKEIQELGIAAGGACTHDKCSSHDGPFLGFHSPGIWQVDEDLVYALNEFDCNRFSAQVKSGLKCEGGKAELSANAKIMSASKEMAIALLTAYKVMLSVAEASKSVPRSSFLEIEYALTKANIDYMGILGLKTPASVSLYASQCDMQELEKIAA